MRILKIAISFLPVNFFLLELSCFHYIKFSLAKLKLPFRAAGKNEIVIPPGNVKKLQFLQILKLTLSNKITFNNIIIGYLF